MTRGRAWFARQMLFIVAPGLAYPFMLLLFGSPRPVSYYVHASTVGLAYAVSIGGLMQVLAPCLGLVAHRLPRGWAWPFIVAALVAAAAAGSLLGGVILMTLGYFPARDFWLWYAEAVRFAVVITLIAGIGSSVLRSLRGQLEDAELHCQRAVALAAEARLASLESRVHPHFLFNALNSISALIREDPARAERLLGRMAALLRASLDAGTRPVPLERELELVDGYLQIEAARLGERLRYTLDVDPAAAAALIPPFALQTLVENSVKYAVANRREGGAVEVRGRVAAGALSLVVRDDGPGFSEADLIPGHGVDTLRARLAALYGDGGRLEIRGSEVTLRVPVVER